MSERMDGWPEWMKRRVGTPRDLVRDPPKPNVDRTEPEVRRLYSPDGKVIAAVSDRPPVGFHQGTRSRG